MVLCDTDALVGLLTPGHVHEEKARRDLAKGPLYVTWGSLVEVARVVRRNARYAGRDGNKAAKDAIAAVTGLGGFREARKVPLVDVIKTHAEEAGLSFVDAWNLVAAIQSKEPLVTYDKRLAAAYKKRA